jgi:hypothetical protein
VTTLELATALRASAPLGDVLHPQAGTAVNDERASTVKKEAWQGSLRPRCAVRATRREREGVGRDPNQHHASATASRISKRLAPRFDDEPSELRKATWQGEVGHSITRITSDTNPPFS